MQPLRYIITANIILLCFAASAQTVNLSRMQRALGKDRIIFTDSTGQQQYRLLKNILDTMITAGNVGSGTTGTIAMWSADTLRNSRITQQDSTITVTPVTGDFPFTFRYRAFGIPYNFYPELRYQWLGFYGDDDVGIKYTGTNTFQMFAGSGGTNRYVINATSSQFRIDGDRDGIDDIEVFNGLRLRGAIFTTTNTSNTTHIAGLASSNEVTKVALGRGMSVAFGASVDTLRSLPGTGTTNIVARWSADTLTNSGIISDGSTIAFDPGLNGVYDVSIGESLMNVESISASLQVTAGSSLVVNGFSTSDAEALGGWTSGNSASKVVIGSGFSFGRGATVDTLKYSGSATTIDTFTFANDTLRLSLTGDGQPAKIVDLSRPYCFVSRGDVSSSQSFTIAAGTAYDTLNLVANNQVESGITYGSPGNGSNDSTFIFSQPGFYMMTINMSVENDQAGPTESLFFRLHKNATTIISGSNYRFPSWETNQMEYGYNCIFEVAANDNVRLMIRTGDAGGGTLTIFTPKISIVKVD